MDPYRELLKLHNRRGSARPPDPSRAWYRIENHTAKAAADIYLYDIIGEDPFFGGISAKDFVAELRGISAKNIALHINSIGGDVYEGKAIRTALAEHPANIETRIDGIAASTASWVGLVANKVIIAPHANMVIHEPFYGLVGDAAAMRKAADALDAFGNDIASMYQEKAGGTVDEWRARMRAETSFSDRAAVDARLADEMGGSAAAQDSVSNIVEHMFNRLGGAPARPQLPRNAAGGITLTPDQLAQVDTYLDAIEANAGAVDASVDAIEAILGLDDEADEESAQNRAPHPEMVRAALMYHREESRRLGVA